MILDLMNCIKDYLPKIRDVLNICTINKYNSDNMYIENLYNFGSDNLRDLNKLTQDVIEQKRYSKLVKLYMYNNKKINNLNHLKGSLKVLDCGMDYDNSDAIEELDVLKNILGKNMYSYVGQHKGIKDRLNDIQNLLAMGICQEGISELNLVELRCDGNMGIHNVNHMKNTLTILSCKQICGIDQNGISELKLVQMECDNNPKIRCLNHMSKTLRVLECRNSVNIKKKYGKMIGQDGIFQLQLEKICIGGNYRIKDLNHMKNTLKTLDLGDSGVNLSGLLQEGISELRLECLYLDNKIEEIDLSHMADTLKILKMYQPIDISKLQLSELYAYGTSWHMHPDKINLNHMKKSLKKLVIINNRYIEQNSISDLELEYLHVENTIGPLNFHHMRDATSCNRTLHPITLLKVHSIFAKN